MKSRINKLEYSFIMDKYNNKFYHKNNKYHRDGDLPAVIWISGSRHWYKNGLRHRDKDKPSSIFSDGGMHWYENGKFYKD